VCVRVCVSVCVSVCVCVRDAPNSCGRQKSRNEPWLNSSFTPIMTEGS